MTQAAKSIDPRIDVEDWSDPIWRLNNLYWITDANGQEIRFKLNRSQRKLLAKLWRRNLILKSRQQGFSTLVQLLMLDACLFIPNTQAGIILQTMDDAKALFRNKIKFAYSRLPDSLRASVLPISDSKTSLELSNGSTLRVSTSLRSGTYQFVHVSEMGKIARKFPDRAREIVTGTFPTVHQDGFLFVESTAEGRDGVFYKMCTEAKKLHDAGARLTALDFRFHFFAWWQDARNRLDPADVVITPEREQYFARLEADRGIKTDAWQRAWYVKTAVGQEVAGKEGTMQQEHPSYPDEAFEVAVDGAIYGRVMTWLRTEGRIRRVDVLPQPVNTFWDLGHNDINAIWFHQSAPMGEHRFIDYEEGFGLDLEHYVKEIRKRGYIMGKWFLPHDARNKNVVGKSAEERLIELGVPRADLVVVERTENLNSAIEQTRKMMRSAWIDETRCAKGIEHLDNYAWRWNTSVGAWMREPIHNEASNAADAIRQWAQAWEQALPNKVQVLKRRGSPMAR